MKWVALTRVDRARAARAGAIASAAYAAEMLGDLRILRYDFNDFTLLGRPFSKNRSVWLPIGAAIHMFNGTALGLVYGWVHQFLRGPGWFRGLCFAQTENLVLWPLMLVVDRFHPARREGQLAAGWSKRAFLVGVLRHAAYGVTLGALYRPVARTR